MPEFFIGLMSGTSMDGIDAALVDFSGDRPRLIASHMQAYPDTLRRQLAAAIELQDPCSTDLSEIDQAVGQAFADAAGRLLATTGVSPGDVIAIGSHGQTIRHGPDAPQPYSLQVGNAETIATLAGIDVVADFRRADIEAGGQGAPLVPAFHRAVFAATGEDRAVVNIGGIANITILPGDPTMAVTGFDTGPGNTLMDQWADRNLGKRLDVDGRWAAGGTACQALLEHMLQDGFFIKAPPKSTGREYFNLDWLAGQLDEYSISPQDIQATLCALTAGSIANAIRRHASCTRRLLVCGGGAHNRQLMKTLQTTLAPVRIESTHLHGVDPDWVEAVAFAWLARQRMAGKPGNIPAVTGARRPVLLGRMFTSRAG